MLLLSVGSRTNVVSGVLCQSRVGLRRWYQKHLSLICAPNSHQVLPAVALGGRITTVWSYGDALYMGLRKLQWF